MKNKNNTGQPDSTRLVAWFMLVIFSTTILLPGTSYAGGPGQPEVSGFTPIGVSDMVDPFTGDFSYNIPLMDIEGYPINIAYQSGITMDQEASWVGLGWNLNVGSVVRNMRGVPDDFNGDKIVKVTHQKPNRTYTISGKLGVELVGKESKKNTAGEVDLPSLNMSLGMSYNNYNGYATQFSIGPSFNLMKGNGHKLTAGFSLSGSSENGASFSPSLSFESKLQKSGKFDGSLTGTVGSSFNSRAGLSYVSYGVGVKRNLSAAERKNALASMNAGSLREGSQGSFDLGLASYSPSAGNSMRSVSITGSWKMGLTIYSVDGTGDISFTYSSQWIPKDNERIESPAYGYFNLGAGQRDKWAILDFNRDNEGTFTKSTPFLASAHLTNDIYSLNAQGISGSYRGFRNDVGYVFDPCVRTVSSTGSVGLETGVSATAKFGMDFAYNQTSAETGGWIASENNAWRNFMFDDATVSPSDENFAMQEANERAVNEDPLYVNSLGGTQAMFFPLTGKDIAPKLENVLRGAFVSDISNPSNERVLRHKRNQVMQFLSHDELGKGFGVDIRNPKVFYGAKGHHIGEIIQTGTDGRRYVFGIAAYNHMQEEVSFSTGKNLDGQAGLTPSDYYNGLINYPVSAASTSNTYGLDNYYSSTTTPAHAHSYLLTSVLSDDYIDSDGKQGPTQEDQGTFVKFSYKKTTVAPYKWRTPMGANTAFRNEGLKVDATDDKASFVYGEKDLWYIDTIQTKNYIAVFKTEPRRDGHAVNDKNGGVNGGNQSQHLLRKISLYAKAAYLANPSAAVPIQEVHFEYSYELCANYPGNAGVAATAPDVSGTGKLTLKKIYFTYQGSKRMKHSPYIFNYGDPSDNPSYNMKAVDRWGNYKPTTTASVEGNPLTSEMNNADFPYTDQDPANTDKWVASWSLKEIRLPSGGAIKVEYESDDYAYVQNRKAMRMFPIALVHGMNFSDINSKKLFAVADDGNKNRKIYFKMDQNHTDPSEYISMDQYMYFRCLTSFTEAAESDPRKYEYVSGYGVVNSMKDTVIGGIHYGIIGLRGEKLLDNGSAQYSPIAKSAIQFGRMHLSRYIHDIAGLSNPTSDSEQGFLDFAGSVVNAFTSLGELFTGPNIPIYNKGRGTKIVTQKSWIRLVDPTGKKRGGGLRVSRILMADNWNTMSGMPEYEYGQKFTYEMEDGTSSGVASYEPQVGGDENPWRVPVAYSNKLRMSPDENLYIETPLMESLFPSPSVGYARIEIRDLERKGVVRTATGKVVKEFYTAKDFPTITRASDIDPKTANSFLPLVPKYQYLTVSQGFSIELNDMHGKPKSESVYAQDKKLPISKVEYFYKTKINSILGSKLDNQAKVIYPDGSVGTAELGVKYDAVADFRQSETKSLGGALQFNVCGFLVGPIPVIIPTAWPSIDKSENKFRSAGFTKVINRFGILEKTIADQDGSVVETNNVAFDSETGEVLLTQTTTNFNDQVYSMNYPAYWGYDQLGGAYRNIGVQVKGVTLTNGSVSVANARKYFAEGDELAISGGATVIKGWVSEVTASAIQVINRAGNPVSASGVSLKVIRSGRKNKQSVSMASMTTLENPLSALANNSYSKVLNAGAVEFGQDWKTYCNCFAGGATSTLNPFILGSKGNWRPVKSYTHLSGRTQSNYNSNTNIRQDGVFTSYTPYYKNVGGKWKENGLNWTYVSEVTEFSPNGMALETKDALNRYSASNFGFNNTLTTAVGANTRLAQMGYASFEDMKDSKCTDIHFKFDSESLSAITNTDAHTGRNSIRATSAASVRFTSVISSCVVLTCDDFKLSKTSSMGVYDIFGGVGPYLVETDIISGTGEVEIENNQLTMLCSAFFKVQVTITDSKGCKLVKTISMDPSSQGSEEDTE